ncbi:MAG: hypothetical protein LBQ83_06085 [Candidatus Margulisbacteria bacterium]|jgi:hypothetical protein|nr:hypothetical protein [Candidatus Margulisiibacteriota bacterium]
MLKAFKEQVSQIQEELENVLAHTQELSGVIHKMQAELEAVSTTANNSQKITEIQEKYAADIPADIVAETAAIIAARENIKKLLAFFLYTCSHFLQLDIQLNTPYTFTVENQPFEGENFMKILHNNKIASLNHKMSEFFIQQFSPGEHSFVFYLNEQQEIGLRVDGKEISPPAGQSTPSRP